MNPRRVGPEAVEARVQRQYRLHVIGLQLAGHAAAARLPPPYEAPPSYAESQLAAQAVSAMGQQQISRHGLTADRIQSRRDYNRAVCKLIVLYVAGAVITLMIVALVIYMLSCQADESSTSARRSCPFSAGPMEDPVFPDSISATTTTEAATTTESASTRRSSSWRRNGKTTSIE